MKILMLIIISLVLILIVKKLKESKKENFKDLVKKAFPKYVIREKNEQIMICEYNHRNEPEEIVFIKISNNKNIKKSGRLIIAEYAKKPTIKEMKQDLGKYLN
ncbi:hypothetical protein C9426_27255 [Serratia sp. S1B]|nr:hypothetical protein C9426_27255 [Serratia sp. S1B]